MNFYSDTQTAGMKLGSTINQIKKELNIKEIDIITPISVRKGIAENGKMQEHSIDASRLFNVGNFWIEFWTSPEYDYVYLYCKGWDAYHESFIMHKTVARQLWSKINKFNKENPDKE